MAADVPIGELLANLGFVRREAEAREVLTHAGLTRPGKSLISGAKRERVRLALRAALILSCDDKACQVALRLVRPGARVLVAGDAGECERCGGSNNVRAVQAFLEACQSVSLRKLVVVGGSPATRFELRSLLKRQIDLRLVDGTARLTRERADADLQWADLVLVWGATQLDHRVSALYTDPLMHADKVVTIARRGVAALVDAGRHHLAGRGGPLESRRSRLDHRSANSRKVRRITGESALRSGRA